MTVLDDIADALGNIAESLRDLWDLASSVVTDALGFSTPRDQMVANIVVAGAIIATSAVGLLGTLLLLPLPILFFILGALRFWEPFDRRWPLR